MRGILLNLKNICRHRLSRQSRRLIPQRSRAAGSGVPMRSLLLFLSCRRWWGCADIAPRIRILYCIRARPLNRRFIGAINGPILLPFFFVPHRAVSRHARCRLRCRPSLSESGAHYQNNDQRGVDGFARHSRLVVSASYRKMILRAILDGPGRREAALLGHGEVQQK